MSGGRDSEVVRTASVLQDGFRDGVECRFWSFRVGCNLKSVLNSKDGLQNAPRKLSKIFAAFSASPGRLKPCTNSRPSDASRFPLVCMNAVACSPAFCAPWRNLSSIDMMGYSFVSFVDGLREREDGCRMRERSLAMALSAP